MEHVVTVRLDAKRRAALARTARRRGLKQSEVMRQALDLFLATAPNTQPYESWAPHIGMVASGEQRLSEKTGRRFTRLLAARRTR